MASYTDDDDISLCSTTWTEYRSDYGEGKDYHVGRILAECKNEDNTLLYLLQWEGYGNDRATWEHEEIVPDDKIQMWLEHKDRVNAQIETPFDLEGWARDVNEIRARKEDRKERRAAKRRRLGITKKYRPGEPPSPADANQFDPGNDAVPVEDPLFEPESHEGQLPSSQRKHSSQSLVSTPTDSGRQPSAPGAQAQPAANNSDKVKNTLRIPQPSATKNVTTASVTRKPVNIFARKWDDRTQRKRRGPGAAQAKPSEELLKETPPRKVLTLSQMNKINKANSRERAPDLPFEELQKVYTRKPSVPTPSLHTSSTAAMSVVEPAAVPPAAVPTTSEWMMTPNAASTTLQAPKAPTEPRHSVDMNRAVRQKTCYFWAEGRCRKKAEDCHFAHHFLPEFAVPPGWSGLPPKGWPGSVTSPTATVASLTGPASNIAPTNVSSGQPTPHKGIPARLTTPILDELDIELWPAHPSIAVLLMNTRGPNPNLSVNFTATDKIYDVFMSSEPLKSVNIHFGDVSVTKTDSQPAETLHQYHAALSTQARSMEAGAAASVIAYQEWAMLIYFASDSKGFGDHDAEQHSGADHQLRFQLISPLPSIHTPPTVTVMNDSLVPTQERFVSYLYRQFAGIYSSDFERMLEWFDGKMLDKHVFLRFEGHPHERDLLVTLTEHLVASVTVSDHPNAWPEFVNRVQHGHGHHARGSGVVIFHPANRRFDTAPDLWKLMLSSVNFYMFGPCTNDHFNRYNTFEPIQLWKMWTTGTVTMISEDLLSKHPKRAQQVVNYIVKKAANRPFKDRTWKLFTRPNVIGWLRETAIERKNAEPQRPWREWKLLADSIHDNLCPEGYFVPGSNDPLPEATLVSGTTDDYVQHVRTYKDGGRRSDEELEVMYFAHWSLPQVFDFRRFCVLVPEVTPEYARVQGRWQHIEILTPEKYLERYAR